MKKEYRSTEGERRLGVELLRVIAIALICLSHASQTMGKLTDYRDLMADADKTVMLKDAPLPDVMKFLLRL